MNRPNDLGCSPRLEQAVNELYATFGPDPAAVARMERRLLAKARLLEPGDAGQEAMPAGLLARWRSFWVPSRPRWAFVMLLAVLMAALAITAIGPQRVLADLQRLFGYVPGIGFVQIEETRVLAAPAELQRGSTSIVLEEVLARPDQTRLVLRFSGMPNSSKEAMMTVAAPRIQVLLPDGRPAGETGGSLIFGIGGYTAWARLTLGPLPADTRSATVVVDHLPGARAEVPEDEWRLDFKLVGASERASTAFPQLYQPIDARDVKQGVSVQVMDVAQTSGETGISIAVRWPDPIWSVLPLGLNTGQSIELRDDMGHVYAERPRGLTTPQVQNDSMTSEDTRLFAPVSPAARQLSFSIDELQFSIPAGGEFVVDLGEDPRLGDWYPVGASVDISGVAVTCARARLVERTVGGQGAGWLGHILELEFASVPEGGKRISDLTLDVAGAIPAYGKSNDTGQFTRGYEFTGEPASKVRVDIQGATLAVYGPWEATWNVPSQSGR